MEVGVDPKLSIGKKANTRVSRPRTEAERVCAYPVPGVPTVPGVLDPQPVMRPELLAVHLEPLER